MTRAALEHEPVFYGASCASSARDGPVPPGPLHRGGAPRPVVSRPARRALRPRGRDFDWQGWIGAGAGLARVRGHDGVLHRRRRDDHRPRAAHLRREPGELPSRGRASAGAPAGGEAALYFNHVSRHYVDRAEDAGGGLEHPRRTVRVAAAKGERPVAVRRRSGTPRSRRWSATGGMPSPSRCRVPARLGAAALFVRAGAARGDRRPDPRSPRGSFLDASLEAGPRWSRDGRDARPFCRRRAAQRRLPGIAGVRGARPFRLPDQLLTVTCDRARWHGVGIGLALIPQRRARPPAPQEDRMDLIITLIIGGVIGWVASIVMKSDAQMGMIANVLDGHRGLLPRHLAGGRHGVRCRTGRHGTWSRCVGAMLLIGIVRALGLFGGRRGVVDPEAVVASPSGRSQATAAAGTLGLRDARRAGPRPPSSTSMWRLSSRRPLEVGRRRRRGQPAHEDLPDVAVARVRLQRGRGRRPSWPPPGG